MSTRYSQGGQEDFAWTPECSGGPYSQGRHCGGAGCGVRRWGCCKRVQALRKGQQILAQPPCEERILVICGDPGEQVVETGSDIR